jgi:hypothetical protein
MTDNEIGDALEITYAGGNRFNVYRRGGVFTEPGNFILDGPDNCGQCRAPHSRVHCRANDTQAGPRGSRRGRGELIRPLYFGTVRSPSYGLAECGDLALMDRGLQKSVRRSR